MHHRWMVRRDVPVVLELDRKTSSQPWDESTLIQYMQRRECIGWVVDVSEPTLPDTDIVGFVVFERRENELAVIKYTIDPSFSGCGAEVVLWDKLVRYSKAHGLPHISVPDGFRVPVGGVDPLKPLIVECRDG